MSEFNGHPSAGKPPEDWYSKATVRNAPRRILGPDELELYRAFPEQIVPLSTHPLIITRGLTREILLHALSQHLAFTQTLETEAVNPVLLRIATAPMFSFAHASMRDQAMRYYVDEGYHALFSREFARQLTPQMTLDPSEYLTEPPRCFSVLNETMDKATDDEKPILSFLFAVVSETLITGTLVEAPKCPQVAPSVRAILMDHAMDEARHHSFFSRIFEEFWPRLSSPQRSRFSDVFGDFIGAFLSPDFEMLRRMLRSLGLSNDEAIGVLADCYPDSSTRKTIKEAAAATLSLLRRNGVRCEPCIPQLISGQEHTFRGNRRYEGQTS